MSVSVLTSECPHCQRRVSPKELTDHDCPLRPEVIEVHTTGAVVDALDALVATGLWGLDRSSVAEELLRNAIREIEFAGE